MRVMVGTSEHGITVRAESAVATLYNSSDGPHTLPQASQMQVVYGPGGLTAGKI